MTDPTGDLIITTKQARNKANELKETNRDERRKLVNQRVKAQINGK